MKIKYDPKQSALGYFFIRPFLYGMISNSKRKTQTVNAGINCY